MNPSLPEVECRELRTPTRQMSLSILLKNGFRGRISEHDYSTTRTQNESSVVSGFDPLIRLHNIIEIDEFAAINGVSEGQSRGNPTRSTQWVRQIPRNNGECGDHAKD
jgi:hypothetical protein